LYCTVFCIPFVR